MSPSRRRPTIPASPDGEPGSGVAAVIFERARAGSCGLEAAPRRRSDGSILQRAPIHTPTSCTPKSWKMAATGSARAPSTTPATRQPRRKRKSKSPTPRRRPRSRRRSPAWWRQPKTSRSSAPSPPAPARDTKRKPGPTASPARHPRPRVENSSNTPPKATSSCCCAIRKRAAGRSPTCRAKPAAQSRSSCWRPMSSTSTRAAGSR